MNETRLRPAFLFFLVLLLLIPVFSTERATEIGTQRILEARAFDEARMVEVMGLMHAGDLVNPGDFYNYGPLTYYAAYAIDLLFGPARGTRSAMYSLRLVSWISAALFLLFYRRAFAGAPARAFWLPLAAMLLSPEFFNYTSRAHPDLPQFLLLFGAFLAAPRRPHLAAALLALAASTKFAGVILLPALLLAPPREAPLRDRARWLFVFGLVFLFTQPRLWLAPEETIAGIRAHTIRNFSPKGLPSPFLVWPALFFHPEGLGGLLPVLGLWGLAREARGSNAGVARFGLAWFFLFLLFLLVVVHSDYGTRHLFPLLPPLLWGAVRLLERPMPRAIPWLMALLLVIPAAATERRVRQIYWEGRPGKDDLPALAGIPHESRIWAESLIYVPESYPNCLRFYGGMFYIDSGATNSDRADYILFRPSHYQPEFRRILSSYGYSPAGETAGIEIWMCGAATCKGSAAPSAAP